MKLVPTQWLVGLALLGASCTEPAELDAGSAALLGGLLAKVQAAPIETPHQGVRRIEVHWLGEWGPESFGYREAVQVDGQGQYALETLEVLSPVALELGHFLLLQQARAGFFFRYRDVALRDLDLAFENFQITDSGQMVQVAGRDALHLALVRTTGEPLRHDVAIDVETGLILGARTFDANGALLSSMEFETLELGAPADMDPHVPTNQELVIEPGPELDEALGFPAVLPALLPDGYRLLETARIVDASGRVWLKATYTDGVDAAFYLTRPTPLSATIGGTPVIAASASKRAVTSPSANDGEAPVLRAFRAAGIQVLEGRHAGREVIAVGRLPAVELQWMLESTFPE